MHFGVLGPFEVVDDQGRELALGGPKQRSVLALLLLHRGEIVSSERLVRELWGERAPPSAPNTIHVYISNLRKALGEGRLLTRPTGYLLQTEHADVDVDRFELLLTLGRQARRQGDAPGAHEALREALGLWRGAPYADFAYEAFAQREIARLDEARLNALEERIDAQLELGDHAAVVGELEALSAEQPVREHVHEQLMLALYRCGRQADALRAYRRIRTHLVDELGLEPGPVLKRLQAQILEQDPALHPQGSAPASRAPTRGGAGMLLERAAELAALEARLADVERTSAGRLVVVHGEAGIGKTALLRRFCDGLAASVRLLWASCDPLFAPRPLGPLLDVARATAGELRRTVDRPAKPHDVAAALLGELESRSPTVLVLEDLHWVDEATADVVRLLSRRVPSVPALLLLSYRDDELDRLHPLRTVLGDLPTSEVATRLELARLSRVAVTQLAEATPADADELYARTAGNPFFVTETLAANTEQLPSTVRDAVLARTARLEAGARRLLDALSVVPQQAELWLLEALLEGDIGALGECVGSGMLEESAHGIGFRHELARLAVEQSLAADRRVALHRRALAALTDPPTGGVLDLPRLAHHAEGAADIAAVLRFAPSAAEEAASVGAHREAAGQYARALRSASSLSPEARAGLLERFAHECFLTDMRLEALDALDEALEIYRRCGDIVRQGDVQHARAELLGCAGRLGEARATFMDAVTLLEQAAPGPELAQAYAGLAGIHVRADEAGQAATWGTRALALAERIDDVKATVDSLNLLGTIELARGTSEGRSKLERSVELARQAGLTTEAGMAYINLVSAFNRRREWEIAERYLSAGADYCREHGLEAWLSYM
ncbi:MAG: AAA family ATPase, partial [Solirubrobacterales bacterium]|nr:AAA family ATPase [Solirubrobacterales bacterium]